MTVDDIKALITADEAQTLESKMSIDRFKDSMYSVSFSLT